MPPAPDAVYAINPNARPQAYRVGQEGDPIVVIDDIFLHPDRIVDYAAEGATFGPGGAGYPGIRAQLPNALADELFYGLMPLARQVFGIGEDLNLNMMSSYSMVTEAPTRTWTAQLLPHYDNADARALAIVIYLCDPIWGGTALYRHRSTGFEIISRQREEPYNQSLAVEVASTELPEQFPYGNHPLFEAYRTVDAKFNRLAMYRSCLLHSASLTPSSTYTEDPRRGRLTITAFLRPA